MTVFALRTFGCRVNSAEASSWSEKLRDGGLVETDDWSRSDLILVNSCTLTSRADRDVRRFIRKAGRENPKARIVVAGCLAERAPEILAGMPRVCMVLPNAAKDELADRILAAFPAAGSAAASKAPPPRKARVARSRAVLKVQDGCDGGCAYCIIPAVRGPGRSLPRHKALASAAALAGRGFGEIVLTGIDLASYGRDLDPPESLSGLVEAVCRIPGPVRIRLSSLDPRSLDTADVRRLAENPRIRPHFHLSLQHASDDVLERMNRGRPAARQRELLSRLHASSPDAALGADFLVGFPGETEEEFATLFDFAAASPLTYFHVFTYSPRPGTPAADMDGRVPESVMTARAVRLRRLSSEKNRAFRARFTGSVRPGVVVERRGGGVSVLTDNYIEVAVPSGAPAPGNAVDVRMGAASPHATLGEVVPR